MATEASGTAHHQSNNQQGKSGGLRYSGQRDTIKEQHGRDGRFTESDQREGLGRAIVFKFMSLAYQCCAKILIRW